MTKRSEIETACDVIRTMVKEAEADKKDQEYLKGLLAAALVVNRIRVYGVATTEEPQ